MKRNDFTHTGNKTNTTAATDESVTRQIHDDRNGEVSVAQKKWSDS